jgi:hypothetical protein
MLVEITGTEQMTTASFDVVGLHLPRGFPGSRGHEDYDAHREQAYSHPACHIYLPFMFRIGLGSRGVVLVERILQLGDSSLQLDC